jgi:RimJ/RimL family protein N-acetyltransferase
VSARILFPEVNVRPLTRADVRDLRDAFAAGRAAPTTRYLLPRSLPSMLDWYDQIHRTREALPFAIMHGSELIGYCSLRSPIFFGKQLVIAIFNPRYRGSGIGTSAVTKLCELGFRKLRLRRIELGVYPWNRQAIACYARCGFKYEATLREFLYHNGDWADVMLMSLLRSEWRQGQGSTQRT